MYTHVWMGSADSTLCLRPASLAVCSEEGQEEERSREGSEEIRWDLVARVREEIAAGTYDTEEKWQAALDRFLGQSGLQES